MSATRRGVGGDTVSDELDDWIERALEALGRGCIERNNQRAEEILRESWNQASPMAVPDDGVILLGFEEQVDVVWNVPKQRPPMLLRPLPVPRRQMLATDVDPIDVAIPSARYDRVGEFTYRRTR